MADTDSISDATPRKRQKRSNGRPYDSQDDSGDELTSDDFNTVATLPLPGQKRKLACSSDQLHRDLGLEQPSSSHHTSQSLPSAKHITQPTQALASTADNRHMPRLTSSPPPSEVQVGRSSPPMPMSPPLPQRAHPSPIRRAPFAKPGLLASAMAPPGTAFRRPLGVQSRPATITLDSDDDDPPVHHSSDEGETQSALKPTNFKKGGRGLDSTPNRTDTSIVKESPRPSNSPSAGDSTFLRLMRDFQYNPANAPSDSASAYGSASRRPRPMTQASPRPRPAVTAVTFKTLDDVVDHGLRRKVEEIQGIFPDESVQRCMDALARKRGNVNDSMEWLSDTAKDHLNLNDADELAAVVPQLKRGVAVSKASLQSSQPVRPGVKAEAKAPALTIAEKYRSITNSTARRQSIVESEPTLAHAQDDDAEDEELKPRRRLLQGRKAGPRSPSPSSPVKKRTQPNQRAPPPGRKPIVISDDDGSEIETDAEETADREIETSHDKSLLQFFNQCSVREVVDLCNQPEDMVQFVLDQRPFASLDAIRSITRATETKSGKKSKARPIGDKIVDVCGEVRTGLEAVDELVDECERIAKPIQSALRSWGVGRGEEGELEVMKLDEAHDSGVGTPASSCPSDDAPVSKLSKKGQFLGQPENMSPDVTLKDYQLVGLNWLNLLWSKKISCILADDMGLGKTCQIIAFLAHLQRQKVDGVHLVIVPGSTLENWLREFERFAPALEVRPYYGSQSERAELRESIEADFDSIDVVITTYDMATRKEDNYFLRRRVDPLVTVYDEAHMLRNTQTERYRQLLRIPATFRVLLTGTPLQNNLQELVAILAFIMPELFAQKKEELQYLFQHKASTKDTDHAALLSAQRIARARSMITPFILRRKKKQVLDLPPKHCRVEYCEMTPNQANGYADLLDEAQQALSDKLDGKNGAAGAGKSSSSTTTIMGLRQAAIHPLLRLRLYDDRKLEKIATELLKREWAGNPRERVLAYLRGEHHQSFKGGDFGMHRFCEERADYLSRFMLKPDAWMDSGKVAAFSALIQRFAAAGEQTLVFSQFTTLLDILEAVLDTLGLAFKRLDGSTDMARRQEMIDDFSRPGAAFPVFLLSTRAGGAGLNLAAASKVVIFDAGFNPQDDVQAENRAHRVGQTRPVEVVRLVSRGTIEEQMLALGESKLALDARVSNGGGDGAPPPPDAATAASAAADDVPGAPAVEDEQTGQKMVEEMLFKQLEARRQQQQNHSETKQEGERNAKSPAQAKRAKPKKAAAATAGGTADIKDAFKAGMEKAGVKVRSKQAQF